ncbi:MAG: hypothetical protein ABIP61_00250 [Burkholderiaceae bacterium]
MGDESSRVRGWDLPTGFFHWLLAAGVSGSVSGAWIGGDAMLCPMRLGFAVFTLLAFGLLWGWVGGARSRFSSFLSAPSALLRYLRRQSRPSELHDVGHHPLGAFSVFAFPPTLALVGARAAAGTWVVRRGG